MAVSLTPWDNPQHGAPVHGDGMKAADARMVILEGNTAGLSSGSQTVSPRHDNYSIRHEVEKSPPLLCRAAGPVDSCSKGRDNHRRHGCRAGERLRGCRRTHHRPHGGQRGARRISHGAGGTGHLSLGASHAACAVRDGGPAAHCRRPLRSGQSAQLRQSGRSTRSSRGQASKRPVACCVICLESSTVWLCLSRPLLRPKRARCVAWGRGAEPMGQEGAMRSPRSSPPPPCSEP